MLPPFIIEQIRQREEKERARREDEARPRLELPLDHPLDRSRRPGKGPQGQGEVEEDDPNRGVVIVDLMG